MLGIFYCGCCCEKRRAYDLDEDDDSLMRCTECGCTKEREDARLKIRLYVSGQVTIKAQEDLLRTARLLGAGDDARILREHDSSHFVEIDAAGVNTRLEIANIKGSVGS